jgi:hypothetical protein
MCVQEDARGSTTTTNRALRLIRMCACAVLTRAGLTRAGLAGAGLTRAGLARAGLTRAELARASTQVWPSALLNPKRVCRNPFSS